MINKNAGKNKYSSEFYRNACKLLDAQTSEDKGEEENARTQFFDIAETADENNLSD
jgi:hypothetical protein